MFRSLWFHNLLQWKSRSVRRRQEAQNRKHVRLRLEALEDRITPTTQTFNPTNATGLKSAFDYANNYSNTAVVINLKASDTYNLNQIGGQLDDKSVAGITINGNGATIHAATNNRVFEVDGGKTLNLKNVTITGGNVSSNGTAKGGGIEDLGGYVNLSNVTVSYNSVHSTKNAEGGGIYVSGSGKLMISNNSHIDNNQAVGNTAAANAAAGNAFGGGIYMSGGGRVSIIKSSVSNNLAQAGETVGGNAKYDALGGGLYLNGQNSVNFTNAAINSNRAMGADAGGAKGYAGGAGEGGGMYLLGDGWNVTITGSSLSNNLAQGGHGGTGSVSHAGGTGGSAAGGGAFVYGTSSFFKLDSSSISGNTAQAGAGGQGGLRGGTGGNGSTVDEGGGMWFGAPSPVPFTISNSSFNANNALGGNGGVGGAGKAGNTGSAGGAGGAGEAAWGGGLFVVDYDLMTITNASFTNNHAVGGVGGTGGVGGHGNVGAGGAGGTGGVGGAGEGGGIYSVNIPTTGLMLINTTVGANLAQGGNAGTGGAGGTGAPHAASGALGKAGVTAGGAFGAGIYDSYGATLINDTVANNSALAGSGGQFSAAGSGGGIYGGTSSNATLLTNDILEGNNASSLNAGPDFLGYVSLGSSYDFISSTAGITDVASVISLTGMLHDSSIPQLGSLTTSPGGLSYYPLLTSSVAINAGTNSVLGPIGTAEPNSPPVTDEIGNPRAPGGLIDLGAVESLAGSPRHGPSSPPPSPHHPHP